MLVVFVQSFLYGVMCVHVPRHSLPANRTLVAGEAPVKPLGATVSGGSHGVVVGTGTIRSGCGPALLSSHPPTMSERVEEGQVSCVAFSIQMYIGYTSMRACVFLNTALICRHPQVLSLEVAAALPGATHRKEGWDNYMKLGQRG